MKILITGARGLLGSNLSLMYSERGHEVLATGRNKPSFNFCRNYEMDITKKDDLKIIEEERPDLVINCVALTNMEYCEDHEEEAEKINAEGAGNLAEICKKNDIYLIHISTDAVFDGEKGNYKEEDETNPLNVYGKTKLLAEELIKEVRGRHAIIRTTIYGWNHLNKFSLAEWILDKFEKGEQFGGFVDVKFTPILTTNLGEALLEIYDKNYIGTLHVGSPEVCSKFDFAKEIARVFGKGENLVIPTSSEKFSFKAKRAKDMYINSEKAEKLLKTKLLNIEEGLIEFKNLKDSGFLDRLRKI